MKRTCILLVVLLAVSLAATSSQAQSAPPESDGESFTILNPQGMKSRGTVQVGGVTPHVESTFSWSLEGIVEEFNGLQEWRLITVKDEVELNLDNEQAGMWDWRFSIDLNLYDRCSCILTVSQIDDSRQQISSDKLALFIGEGGLAMPQIGWMMDDTALMTAGSIYFDAMVFEDPETNQSLLASITPYEGDEFGPPVINGIAIDAVPIAAESNSFRFSYITNVTTDGEYRLSIYSADSLTQTEIIGIDFYLDTTPPIANISCPTEIVEGLSELLVDGTHSTDAGAQDDLTYTWAIEYPDGISSAPEEEMFEQPGLFRFTPEESGTYNLTLRVIDSVGHVGEVTQSVTVLNLDPEAELLADGVMRSDGDVLVTDTDADMIQFQASNSSDTPNDVTELQYAWYLDGVLIGSEDSLLLVIQDLPAESVLKLVVKDDDGASDNISLVLMNVEDEVRMLEEQASTTTSFYTGLNLVLATGLICVILILVVKRNTVDKEDLPKWSRRKGR